MSRLGIAFSGGPNATEIVECVRKGPLAEASRRLATMARERMEGGGEGEPSKPDDLTFAIFRLSR